MTEIPKFYPTLPQRGPLKENVVGQARNFLDDLESNMKNRGIYNSLGIQPDKTFVLSSKPGLGKTLAINALNNSVNENITNKLEKLLKNKPLAEKNDYISGDKKIHKIPVIKGPIPQDFNLFLFEYDIGKYGTAYINMGSKIIQSFFNTCLNCAAYNKPILISIDECDALFNSRKSNLQSHSEDRKVLETLMKNLQISHDTPNIYVVMMTNFVESMDEASIRAGRIDDRIILDMPTFDERKAAYENAINTVNKRAGYKVIRAYDANPLSELSTNFSYADIYQSVEKSLRNKAKELIKTKEPGIIRAGYIKQKKLEEAIKEHCVAFKEKQVKKIGFDLR